MDLILEIDTENKYNNMNYMTSKVYSQFLFDKESYFLKLWLQINTPTLVLHIIRRQSKHRVVQMPM